MANWDDAKLDGEKPDQDFYNEMIAAIKSASYVMNQAALDLSGSAEDIEILHAKDDLVILAAILLYTEASSADAGVEVRIGKESDDNYFYTGTSEVSKSKFYEKSVTLLQTDLDAGDTLTVGSAGGKSGTGEVKICVWYIER